MKKAGVRNISPRAAFTLIELMIVVAIIGLIAALGVPSILQTFRKDGMRKAVSDMKDACSNARARAILSGRTAEIIFYPQDRRWQVTDAPSDQMQMPADNASPNPPPQPAAGSPWSGAASGTLPAGVDFVMVDINLLDYLESPEARVRFFPNGTCDELTLVLHASDEWQKITLEFSTALASVSPVNR